MAIQILATKGDYNPLGCHWVRHFLQRNKTVHMIVSRSTAAGLINAINQQATVNSLRVFDHSGSCLNTQPNDSYNMDESGINLAVCNEFIVARP
ncbi:hypothetical protein COCSADRAFT_104575 [Bipolaris sorokiniana ND90Pr]|uniref:HTH CENPB-type domain-containing protein n=1 Tax=Cochliobolus sativus (strain ND90Pr / ATCC 201652) TaxID=665912 RepID=M2SN16_COCSN|nr:uncharacterized protein COCSADRAFT_104575 [Bipolaris sorokiniana ND90Pr]EMD58167.1 hypothetical protein COCSADRAFT_104575 [Bipolaris sorokiniana ND90Pr]